MDRLTGYKAGVGSALSFYDAVVVDRSVRGRQRTPIRVSARLSVRNTVNQHCDVKCMEASILCAGSRMNSRLGRAPPDGFALVGIRYKREVASKPLRPYKQKAGLNNLHIDQGLLAVQQWRSEVSVHSHAISMVENPS